MTGINDRTSERDVPASIQFYADRGLCYVLDAADLARIVPEELPAGAQVIRFADGRGHLIVPEGVEPPARHTVSVSDGSGGVTMSTYLLSFAPDDVFYVLDTWNQTDGDAAHSTAIDPALGARFVAAGESVIERFGPAPQPQPEPANADNRPLSWLPCSNCHGLGHVVEPVATAALRQAGIAQTVITGCPGCGGSGGMIQAPA